MNISFHCTHAGNTNFWGIASNKRRGKARKEHLSRHGGRRDEKKSGIREREQNTHNETGAIHGGKNE